jgi:Holliday junction resolvasome RuvABC DNA-binding subunit
VVQALKNFGYSVSEAQKAVREVKKDGISTEERIRLALKSLGR